jgi:hypothetical protein
MMHIPRRIAEIAGPQISAHLFYFLYVKLVFGVEVCALARPSVGIREDAGLVALHDGLCAQFRELATIRISDDSRECAGLLEDAQISINAPEIGGSSLVGPSREARYEWVLVENVIFVIWIRAVDVVIRLVEIAVGEQFDEVLASLGGKANALKCVWVNEVGYYHPDYGYADVAVVIFGAS